MRSMKIFTHLSNVCISLGLVTTNAALAISLIEQTLLVLHESVEKKKQFID